MYRGKAGETGIILYDDCIANVQLSVPVKIFTKPKNISYNMPHVVKIQMSQTETREFSLAQHYFS